LQKELRRLLDEISSAAHPNGQAEEPEVEAGIAVILDKENKIIRLQFTSPVTWLGLEMKGAAALHKVLGQKIVELVDIIKKEEG